METVARVALIYVFILLALRILGKREFSQLTPFELVTLMIIPELVQQALVREDFSLTNAFIALSTLFVLVFITSSLAHLNRRVERTLGGVPAVLIGHGRLIEQALSRERVTPDEVFGEMHKVGIEDLDHVKWAILECDGRISIIPYRHPARLPDRSHEDHLA